jgi:branched-chain amino acid transport system substrate-binding protein
MMRVTTIARFVACAAAVALSWHATDALAEAPIKIGVIQTYSGPLSTPGTDASNGFTLFFEQKGYKVAGRTIELLKEDDAANPAQAMERVRRLVERENVHVLSGITSSAVAYAVRDYVDSKEVPLIVMGSAGANGITNERASPYIFRASFANHQFNAPFGPYACQKLGYKRIAVMASDFVTGHEQSKAFKDSYEKAGCKVVKQIFAPLGTVDFAPFLTQVPTGEVDAVWAMFFGADAIGFVKQYDALGLKAKLPLVGSGGLPDERLLHPMGRSSVGITTAMFYTATFDTPANKAFTEAYNAKYKTVTDATSASGYTAAMAIAAAIEAVNGRIEDKKAFLEALRKVELPNSPLGRFRFDEKQNVIFDMVVTRVEEQNGTFLPKVIDELATDVDQFWQYKP